MRHSVCKISLALTALAALALARPGLAQQPPKDLVPFKITVTGKLDAFMIPTDPPAASLRGTFRGSSDLLTGEVTYVDAHIGFADVNGFPSRGTNGIGVFTWPTGEALFVNWGAVLRPTATPGLFQAIASFTITGGRGKFVGATGSGNFTGTLDLARSEGTDVWEGLLSMPKK